MEYGAAGTLGGSAAGRIECQSVRKTYRDAAEGTEVVALDGLTLDIEPREFLTLLGPSGCGKSTLAQHPRRFREARRRERAAQRHADRAAGTGSRRRVPGLRAVSLAQHPAERRVRAAREGHRQERDARHRAALSRHGRAHRLRAALSARALRRHAPARGADPGAGDRSEDPADGRAVRRRRCADAHDPAGGVAAPVDADAQDRRLRHPQRRRGHLPRRTASPS